MKNYCLLSLLIILSLNSQENKQILGKWDLEVEIDGIIARSWLEV